MPTLRKTAPPKPITTLHRPATKPVAIAPRPLPPIESGHNPVPIERVAPRRRRRRSIETWQIILLVIGGFLTVSIVGGATWWHWYSTQTNPNNIFQQAILSSYTTPSIQAQTNNDGFTSEVRMDFSKVKDPLVSINAGINRSGASVPVLGYGTATDTYMSYQNLDTLVPSDVAKKANQVWVHVRQSGKLPPNVGAAIANAADPRYQSFGLLIFGHFSPEAQTKLSNIATQQQVYKYTADDVTEDSLDGTRVVIYNVHLQTNFLRLLNISAASEQGFAPNDIQPVLDYVDSLGGATVKLYVDAHTHHFIKYTLDHGSHHESASYSHYGSAQVVRGLQATKVWKDFAATQLQIDQAVAKRQPATALDTVRVKQLAQLQHYVTRYYQQFTSYPALADMNNPNWRAAAMAGFDPDLLRDPLGNAFELAGDPKANVYAYHVVTSSGKPCDNNTLAASQQICTVYALYTTLSTGKTYRLPIQ